MHVLPKSKQQWFNFVLFPFKAYIIIAPLYVWHVVSQEAVVRYSQAGVMSYILAAYAICIPFFVLASIIQFVARWRRLALTSFAFAAVTIMVFAILLPVVTRNCWVR